MRTEPGSAAPNFGRWAACSTTRKGISLWPGGSGSARVARQGTVFGSRGGGSASERQRLHLHPVLQVAAGLREQEDRAVRALEQLPAQPLGELQRRKERRCLLEKTGGGNTSERRCPLPAARRRPSRRRCGSAPPAAAGPAAAACGRPSRPRAPDPPPNNLPLACNERDTMNSVARLIAECGSFHHVRVDRRVNHPLDRAAARATWAARRVQRPWRGGQAVARVQELERRAELGQAGPAIRPDLSHVGLRDREPEEPGVPEEGRVLKALVSEKEGSGEASEWPCPSYAASRA